MLLMSITFFSCTNEENETSTENSTTVILPKKVNFIENTDYEDKGSDTYFVYDGNKIVSCLTNTRWKHVFTYTGNLITKIESFDYGVLYYVKAYTYYTNGKLETSLTERIKDGNSTNSSRRYFTHSTDGTVSYCTTDGKYKTTFTFKDGNLISDGEETYEYDTKNNPFKNVLGLNAISIDDDREDSIYNLCGKNNCIKSTDSDLVGYTPSITINTITYNSDGYPTVDNEYYNGSTTGNASFKYYYE
jgi:hypothetical protein